MLEAVLKPIEDKWQVVVVDADSEIIWSEPLSLEDAQREACTYNARTKLVYDGLRRLIRKAPKDPFYTEPDK